MVRLQRDPRVSVAQEVPTLFSEIRCIRLVVAVSFAAQEASVRVRLLNNYHKEGVA